MFNLEQLWVEMHTRVETQADGPPDRLCHLALVPGAEARLRGL